MGLRSVRQFVAFVVIPLLLVTLSIGGLTLHLTNRIATSANMEESQRTQAVVRSALKTSLKQLDELTADNAYWDDAVKNIYVPKIDHQFVASTWGDVSQPGKPYEAVLILDANLTTLSAFKHAERAGLEAQSYLGSGFTMLVSQLPKTSSEFGSAAGILATRDGPAFVAAANFVPSTEGIKAAFEEARYLVFVKYINADTLAVLGDNYLISGLSMRGEDASENYEVLKTVDGRDIGALTWKSDRPGDTARHQVMPLAASLLSALMIVLTGIALLSWHQFKTIAARERQARLTARRDALTGLPNRLALMEHIEADLASQQFGACLLYVDLDGFKDVNDTYDHNTGDALIRAVAAGFSTLLDGRGVLSRIGGDEFVILLNANLLLREAEQLAINMIRFLSEPFEIDGKVVSVGASIGLTVLEDPVSSAAELMRRADVAMYAAKARGKNQLVVFDPHMDQMRDESAAIAAELRGILKAGSLAIAYQPCFDAQTLKITGVEALARWPTSSARRVPPDKFIVLAEQAGMIDELGRQIIRMACRDAKQWPGLKVAINVSPYQLRNARFATELAAIVDAAGLDRGRIELELTEGRLVEDTAWLGKVFEEIHGFGFRLALDDFGAGFSSIAYLRKLRFDRIKIDRSMTSEISEDDLSRSFVQATVLIAQSIKAQITAEGVEREAEMTLLRLAGCNDLQGYLLSKPVSAREITAMLQPESDASSVAA